MSKEHLLCSLFAFSFSIPWLDSVFSRMNYGLPSQSCIWSGRTSVQHGLKAQSNRNPITMACHLRFMTPSHYCDLSFSQIMVKTCSYLVFKNSFLLFIWKIYHLYHSKEHVHHNLCMKLSPLDLWLVLIFFNLFSF